MKKRLVASLAAAMVLGVAGSAFAAANPFVDVPANNWAYDSVKKLAKAGIVDGYSNGTFAGDKTMTRYEMAQIVAKAMGNQEKANAEQKAEIKKLQAEYSDELDKLGVRVGNLEKNQPNLKFNGTAEVRYTAQDYNLVSAAGVPAASSVGGAYRMRLEGAAKVDDNTTLGIRLTSGVAKSGTNYKYISGTTTGFGTVQADDNKNSFTFDRFFVTSKIGEVKTTLGAQKLMLGTTQLIVDNGTYSFDGARFEAKSGVVNFAADWGRQQKQAVSTIDLASLEASSTAGKLNYGIGYASLKDKNLANAYLGKYLYGNATYAFDKTFALTGEYVHNSARGMNLNPDGDKNAWNVIATYGYLAPAASGQQNIAVKYYSIGQNSITRFSTLDLQKAATVTEATDVKNLKGLNVTYNYAFSKNLTSYLSYVKVTDKQTTNSTNDMGFNFWRVGLVSKF
jgi:hypothetical protein